MRVKVFADACDDSEEGVPPTTEAFQAIELFIEKLVQAASLCLASA